MGAFDRRTVLKGGAVSAAAAGRIGRVEAAQATAADRGMLGGYHRLPSVDAESRLDFLWGLEAYDAAVQAPAADARALALLESRRIAADAPVETADAVALFGPDETISVRTKTFLEAQRMKIRVVRAALARDEESQIAALDAAMTKGPGTLSLDPDLDVPEYARHSLHMQPGGYVGDPLAGMVFRHAIVGLASGHNFQNEGHAAIAAAVPRPADGRARRILDLGCGIGQLASALKGHYPQAEVWGIDTSAPMLRYAHLRATELGLPLHLAQQSAEAMRFPDAHFDMITASGLFHEIPAVATRAVIAETARLLRPGGTFYPLDLNTAAPFGIDARSRFAIWLSHRWYHEDWRLDYATLDLAAELARAGLQVGRTPKMGTSAYSRENLMATRPA